jgi:hypothetical protein
VAQQETGTAAAHEHGFEQEHFDLLETWQNKKYDKSVSSKSPNSVSFIQTSTKPSPKNTASSMAALSFVRASRSFITPPAPSGISNWSDRLEIISLSFCCAIRPPPPNRSMIAS